MVKRVAKRTRRRQRARNTVAKGDKMRVELTIIAGALSLMLCVSQVGSAAAEPPVFRGLTLGAATSDDVVAALGQPKYGNPAADETIIYDSQQAGHVDSLTFEGTPRKLALVETAASQPGLATRAEILARLGQPEYELRLGRQTMLEYTQRGMRLWVDNKTGATIGTVLFAPQEHPRVPVGEQRSVTVAPVSGPSSPGKPAVFRVGVASRDITPKAEWLAGLDYKSVHDPLEARCVVIAAKGKTIAIVGADTFIFGTAELAPILDAARAVGIDYLLYGSSHTHSAIDCMGYYGPRPNEYDAFAQEQIIACIKAAHGAMTPATIEIAQREIMLYGGRIETISRNWRDPGIVDPYLTVVRFTSTEGKKEPLGTLVQFTCHPERLSGYERAISADWVGPMRRTVEAALGGTCVFLNGPLGGMVSPDGLPGTDRFEDTQRMGTWIGEQAVAAARAGCSPIVRDEIAFQARPLLVPIMGDSLREALPLGNLVLNLIHGSHPTEVSRLDIGEVQFIAVPGELLPDLGFRARARMTGEFKVVVGLANDEIGYIVPAWDYRVGQYEERTSMGPSAAPQIMDAIAELLGK
jgi:hypothetical protein